MIANFDTVCRELGSLVFLPKALSLSMNDVTAGRSITGDRYSAPTSTVSESSMQPACGSLNLTQRRWSLLSLCLYRNRSVERGGEGRRREGGEEGLVC